MFITGHGLSQQGIWVYFWTPKPLKSIPQDTHIFCEEFKKNVNLKHTTDVFHLHIIPMILYKDIMPYLINSNMFMVEIWVYCCPP